MAVPVYEQTIKVAQVLKDELGDYDCFDIVEMQYEKDMEYFEVEISRAGVRGGKMSSKDLCFWSSNGRRMSVCEMWAMLPCWRHVFLFNST